MNWNDFMSLKFYWDADESAGGGAAGSQGAGAEAQQPPAPQSEKPSGTPGDGEDELASLIELIKADPAKTADQIKRLRKEAEKANDSQRELKKKLTGFEEAEKQALEQAGNFKKLYEDQKPEYERLKGMEDTFVRYERFFQEQYKAKRKTIPSQYQELLDGKDPLEALQWMEKYADKLKPPPEPNLDGGARDQKRGNDYLGSPAQMVEASKRFRIPLVHSLKKEEKK